MKNVQLFRSIVRKVLVVVGPVLVRRGCNVFALSLLVLKCRETVICWAIGCKLPIRHNLTFER